MKFSGNWPLRLHFVPAIGFEISGWTVRWPLFMLFGQLKNQ
jgi:hypothetical protein